jgi:hypothetical protein
MEKTTIADTDDPTDSKSVWEALSNVKSAYLQFER